MSFHQPNFNHSISGNFYEDAESTRFTISSAPAEKKKGDFQVHLGDFEWWKFITENFVEHFISDLFCPCRISKTVDGWEILQNVVYPAIYNEFCTSPKKVLLRPIAHQHDSRILHPFPGCQRCKQLRAPKPCKCLSGHPRDEPPGRCWVPDGFSGWNDPRFGKFFWNPFLETCEMWALSHFVKRPDHKCLLRF